MNKKRRKTVKNMSLMAFCTIYETPSNFGVDMIPLKHPETGEKIYYIGNVMMEHWYRKKPGQAGKDGQMWPLCQGLGFDIRETEVHDDIKKELGGSVGTFTKRSCISSKKLPTAILVPHHDDSCDERLVVKDGGNWCPSCKRHPDTQSIQLIYYCPKCDLMLKRMVCAECGVKFKTPSKK